MSDSPLKLPNSDDLSFLSKIPVRPGDEKLLHTGFGKMFSHMMKKGGVDISENDLIRVVKQSLNNYCQDCLRQMRKDDKKAKEALAKLKRVAEGGSPDE